MHAQLKSNSILYGDTNYGFDGSLWGCAYINKMVSEHMNDIIFSQNRMLINV